MNNISFSASGKNAPALGPQDTLTPAAIVELDSRNPSTIKSLDPQIARDYLILKAIQEGGSGEVTPIPVKPAYSHLVRGATRKSGLFKFKLEDPWIDLPNGNPDMVITPLTLRDPSGSVLANIQIGDSITNALMQLTGRSWVMQYEGSSLSYFIQTEQLSLFSSSLLLDSIGVNQVLDISDGTTQNSFIVVPSKQVGGQFLKKGEGSLVTVPLVAPTNKFYFFQGVDAFSGVWNASGAIPDSGETPNSLVLFESGSRIVTMGRGTATVQRQSKESYYEDPTTTLGHAHVVINTVDNASLTGAMVIGVWRQNGPNYIDPNDLFSADGFYKLTYNPGINDYALLSKEEFNFSNNGATNLNVFVGGMTFDSSEQARILVAYSVELNGNVETLFSLTEIF
jgi:hypothetical protein